MVITNVDAFKEALQQTEQTRDPSALVHLFADCATIDTPAREGKLCGPESIGHFWQEYLAAFQTIRSTFTREHTIGDTSILEWVGDGVLANGRPVHYRGVSIITFRGYKVHSFTTYYDSAAFHVLPQPKDDIPKPRFMPADVPIPGPDTNNEGGD
ncbi:MAG: nuclear transport factor 2 family protein [Tepidisphaeraceae bacterium]